MPAAAAQSCHRGRVQAGMCCWGDWLNSLSSTGVLLLQLPAQRCRPLGWGRQTVCRHAHTRLGVPSAPSRHPPGQALLSFVHPSLRVPVGWGHLSSGAGETHPGEGTGRGTGGCPSAESPGLAPLFPLVPGPCPLLSLPAEPLAAESSSPCPGGAGWGGRGEKRHLHPYIRIPHPHPHPASAPALAAGTRLRRGRSGAAPRARSGAGRERRRWRRERREPPGRPALPGPGQSREALRERGAGAARRGGGCRGAGTIKPGVIAFRQMRLPRPSPSPGI